MAIRFLCPNGHKINCPESHVGRTAKCPQCGVAFLVPAPPETQAQRLDGEPAKSGPVPETHTKEPQIEFLCPNGHRLHGPASLQGHPGQCPECGCKFQIPSYDDVSEDEPVEQNLGVGPANGSPGDLAADQDYSALSSFLEGETAAEPAQPPVLEPVPTVMPSEAPSVWPMLIADLWRQRGDSGELEIRLSTGEAVIPHRFAFSQSTREFGVFSLKDADGTFSIVAIAWSGISRVELRGMKNVPKEMFEPRSSAG